MDKKGFTLIEVIIVIGILFVLGSVFAKGISSHMISSQSSIDKTSSINMVKELKLISISGNNLLSGNTRELTGMDIGHDIIKPQKKGSSKFCILFINGSEDKVEIRYNDENGELIYSEIIRVN